MKTRVLWHETAAVAPLVGRTVLGWWTPLCLATVVRRFGDRWHAPGYTVGEQRAPPLYWTDLPEPPLPFPPPDPKDAA
jgi:hypothetical protein